MFKTMKLWIEITKISKFDKLQFSIFTSLEIACFLFLPLSFANIVKHATLQNTQLTYLWALINFSTRTLTIITTTLKADFITNIQAKITDLLTHKITPSTDIHILTICSFCKTLNSFISSCLKMFSISLIATIYSVYLGVYIVATIIICYTISFIIQKQRFLGLKKHNKNDLSNIATLNNKEWITEAIWTIFTFVITLIVIDLINNQTIMLSAFLFLTSFINTHLLNPTFDSNFLINCKLVKISICEYQKEYLSGRE